MTSGPLNSHAQDKCTLQRHAHWFPRLRPGETPHFSTFNDNDFAEAASDAQLNDDRLSTVACRYWCAPPSRGAGFDQIQFLLGTPPFK